MTLEEALAEQGRDIAAVIAECRTAAATAKRDLPDDKASVANNMLTLEEALAEQGIIFDAMIEHRKAVASGDTAI